jgi:hypothetical protein
MGCHTHPYRRTGEKSQTESRKIAHRRLGVGGIQEIALGETFVFWGTFVFFLSCLVETSSLNFCEIVTLFFFLPFFFFGSQPGSSWGKLGCTWKVEKPW